MTLVCSDSNVDTMMTCAMQFQIDLIKRRSREFIELKLEEQLNSRTGGAVNHMLLILGKLLPSISITLELKRFSAKLYDYQLLVTFDT